jgi:hypothetical protein
MKGSTQRLSRGAKTEDQQRGYQMKKSAKQGKKAFSVKRVRGGVPASSSLRAGHKPYNKLTSPDAAHRAQRATRFARAGPTSCRPPQGNKR